MRDLDVVFEALARSAFRRRFALGVREGCYLRERGMRTVLAQHATATCCRSCLAKWHGIAPGKVLDDDERHHVVAIERWLRARPVFTDMPEIVEGPQRELPF
ncbi:hypothetical protein BRCH_03742c [Candidatus Burkholderia brachyanthoides]|nr:hypothetical protein BRCH_03742c [Candidatus Burkholderia brachyanthoides]